tara:strand:- start:236 stop:520 length:285 start_codon:yes stop_codon:yes gene_type:complete
MLLQVHRKLVHCQYVLIRATATVQPAEPTTSMAYEDFHPSKVDDAEDGQEGGPANALQRRKQTQHHQLLSSCRIQPEQRGEKDCATHAHDDLVA